MWAHKVGDRRSGNGLGCHVAGSISISIDRQVFGVRRDSSRLDLMAGCDGVIGRNSVCCFVESREPFRMARHEFDNFSGAVRIEVGCDVH